MFIVLLVPDQDAPPRRVYREEIPHDQRADDRPRKARKEEFEGCLWRERIDLTIVPEARQLAARRDVEYVDEERSRDCGGGLASGVWIGLGRMEKRRSSISW